MKIIFLFLALVIFSFQTHADPVPDKVQESLKLLESDAGQNGIRVGRAIRKAIKSNLLEITDVPQRAWGDIDATQLGGTGVNEGNSKYQIQVDLSLPTATLAHVMGHEYTHIVTQEELADSPMFNSVVHGANLVAALAKNPNKKFNRSELKDIFADASFIIINEANAYLFEQSLQGKYLHPEQWTDKSLAIHLFEQLEHLKVPVPDSMSTVSAIRQVKTRDFTFEENLRSATTDEAFERYLNNHKDLLDSGSAKFTRVLPLAAK
jgi:hypothetical protein